MTNSRPSGGNGSGDERACDHSNRRTKIQTELAEPDPLARMAGPFSGILDQDVVTPKFVAWDSNWNFPKFLRSHPARPGNYVTVTESCTPRGRESVGAAAQPDTLRERAHVVGRPPQRRIANALTQAPTLIAVGDIGRV